LEGDEDGNGDDNVEDSGEVPFQHTATENDDGPVFVSLGLRRPTTGLTATANSQSPAPDSSETDSEDYPKNEKDTRSYGSSSDIAEENEA